MATTFFGGQTSPTFSWGFSSTRSLRTCCCGPTPRTKVEGLAWWFNLCPAFGRLRNFSCQLILQELRAIRLGLLHFQSRLFGLTVGVFSDNTTALAYIRHQGGNLLLGPQRGVTASPPLGRVSQDHSGSPNHLGDQECGRRLSEQEQSGDWLRVNFSSGVCVGSSRDLACNNRPVCHSFELPSTRVFLTSGEPHVSGDRCLPPVLERPPSVRVSALCVDPEGDQQAPCQQGHTLDSDPPLLASAGVVPGPSGSLGGSSDRPSMPEGSTQTTPLPSSSHESPNALSSCMETIKRFAYHLGVSRGVASHLSVAGILHTIFISTSGPAIAAGVLIGATAFPIFRWPKSLIFFFFCVWRRGCRSLLFAGIVQPLQPCLSSSSLTFLPSSF